MPTYFIITKDDVYPIIHKGINILLYMMKEPILVQQLYNKCE
jgi:hypothetical protein